MQAISNQSQSPFQETLSDLLPPGKLAGLQKSVSALQDSPAATPGRSLPPLNDTEGFSDRGQQNSQAGRESYDGASPSGRLGQGLPMSNKTQSNS